MTGFRRWLIVGLLLLLLAVGLPRLRLDTDVLALLPGELPTVRALSAHQRHFDSARELVITLRAADPDTAEEAARSLALHLRDDPDRVRWAVWMPPWEERPDLAAELLAAAWLNQEPAEVEALVSRLSANTLPAHLAATRARMETTLSPADLARAGYDPLGLLDVPGTRGLSSGAAPRFVSADGRFRLLLVTPATELGGYQATVAWWSAVRSRVEAWQGAAPEARDVRLRFTGGPAFTSEIAGGMERDMRGSVVGTLGIIAVLFLWAYRRLRPLVMLVSLLALALLGTLAVGGLVFGRLNAVSLGFAAILLGLGIDYGLVLYQEFLAHPDAPLGTVRRQAGPGIVWGALTTAAAFGALAFSGLPGLVQLGVLVAAGTLLAATLMLGFAVPSRTFSGGRLPAARPGLPDHWVRRATPLLLAGACLVLVVDGMPRLDTTADPLRPTHSEAHQALAELQAEIGGGTEGAWWVIAYGDTEDAVATQWRAAERRLTSPSSPAVSHQFPTLFWPDPSRQAATRAPLAALAADRERLRQALNDQGFSDAAFRAAEVMLSAWEAAGRHPGVYWPTNAVSSWVLAQVSAREPGAVWGLGFVNATNLPPASADLLRADLRGAGLLVGSWETLGRELVQHAGFHLRWVAGLAALLWLGSLLVAFRSLREVGLAVACVLGGLLLLLAVMSAADWHWNLMNLMAVPLIIGAGTDYAIHLQLALRRHGGDPLAVRASTGRAVFLCAATTVAGFGSLGWSNNGGLASLGAVCAAGLASVYVMAAHVLPAWWRHWNGRPPGAAPVPASVPAPPPAPSQLYGPRLWHAAVGLAGRLPLPLLVVVAQAGCLGYALLRPDRRRVVARNLLPLVDQDPRRAARTAWRVFAAFGRKLAHLWAFEAGRPVDRLVTRLEGREHLAVARASGDGLLFVTPHLGNWELGAPVLAAHGIRLLVITQAEPGTGFTEQRQAARARWGIETLVIGTDPFAFLDIIRRLGEGAAVALLLDRPPAPTAVPIRLLDRPFAASRAAADLARATGCRVLPTLLVWTGEGYTARVLPPLPVDRRALAHADARTAFTEDILRAFEPALRQHPEQWFHFVPVWPPGSS